MERPTKIRVIKKEDGYEILCWDELSGSCNAIDLPINGYNALAEHFRTGAMEVSSDELSGLHKHCVINWVATSERLPGNRENVLCYNGHRMIENSWCLHTDQDASWFKERFTHWAKLHEPPCL